MHTDRGNSSSHQLLVPPFRLTTVGRRTIPVAASLLCTSLPYEILAVIPVSARLPSTS